MGARLALGCAVRHPERVARRCWCCARRHRGSVEREARRRADEALAARLECRASRPSWTNGWRSRCSKHSATSVEFPRDRALRAPDNDAASGASLRALGPGAQPPLFESLPGLHVPVLLVAGALDRRFVALAHDLARRLPQAEVCEIADAGHAVHLEQPGLPARGPDFLRRAARPAPFPSSTSGDRVMTDTCTPRPPARMADGARLRGHPLRAGRRAREDHHLPPRGAQRLPPKTLFELIDAFTRAREDNSIGVILFTGEGDLAFCSGGDQRIRGNEATWATTGCRLNVLDLQR